MGVDRKESRLVGGDKKGHPVHAKEESNAM